MGIHTKLQNVYYSMKTRCYNAKSRPYSNYGGRGISVCSEWLSSYESFKDWANANGYAEGLTLDRIDVNGNYCPENCRWVDMKVQSNNRRNNRVYTYQGKTMTLAQWAESLGIPYDCLLDRARKPNATVEDILGRGYRRKKIFYKGEHKFLYEWCKELGLDYSKTNLRLHRGWSIDKAFISKGGK